MNNKTLLLSSSFTVKDFSRILELISQYNLIYKDSDLRLSISNEFIDDSTLYLSIFKLQEKLAEVIGTIEDPYYYININLHKSVTPNTLTKILELTQVDPRVKIIFNIKVTNDLNVLTCLDTINKYSRLLPNLSFFTNIEFYFDDQPNEFIIELTNKLKSYHKHMSLFPTFRKSIVSDDYIKRLLDLVEEIYGDPDMHSPDTILDTHFNRVYGCNVQWNEIPIIFKDGKIYSTYCSNSCRMSSNVSFEDQEHTQHIISNMDDIRNISYIALKPNDKLPGCISCPLQDTSDDYMLINAYLHKVKEILYNRFKN